ncbi:MAG: sulfur carrier protein ThiS [Planctomycetes bacterium]|nr:sulfur carrier protein ThiS [Planctomycetota bacterium]
MMKLIINGEDRTFDEAPTIERLLETKGLGQAPCAVEVNSKLIPKRKHAHHRLREGDVLEIVSLVGGG